MSLTPCALLLLNAQRHHLDDHPEERRLTREWAHQVDEARAQGWLIAFVQWDGSEQDGAAQDDPAQDSSEQNGQLEQASGPVQGSASETGGQWATFSRAWTLHPDFRAEQGDLLVRATLPDAFAGSDLAAQLHASAVQTLQVLALPGTPELGATTAAAQTHGFTVLDLEMSL